MSDETRSDDALLLDLGAAAARARLDRNLTQQELAELAGVSKRTLERFEAGASTTTVNLVRVLRALGLVGQLALVFPAAPPSPLQQLRLAKHQQQRRRASPRRAPAPGTGAGTSEWPSPPASRGMPPTGRPTSSTRQTAAPTNRLAPLGRRPESASPGPAAPFRWGDEGDVE